VLDGSPAHFGEQYPAVAQHLRRPPSPVRDDRSGGGGVIEDDVIVTIDGVAGPFVITSPNTNVTWSGTPDRHVERRGHQRRPGQHAPTCRSCSRPTAARRGRRCSSPPRPTMGPRAVTLPFVSSTTARIRVEAINNIYFDVSNVNFTLQGPPPPAPTASPPHPRRSAARRP
jgi:hypothetical protein